MSLGEHVVQPVLLTTGMIVGIKTMDRVARVGTKRTTKRRVKYTAYGIKYKRGRKRVLYQQQFFKTKSAAIRSQAFKNMKKRHKNPRAVKLEVSVKK